MTIASRAIRPHQLEALVKIMSGANEIETRVGEGSNAIKLLALNYVPDAKLGILFVAPGEILHMEQEYKRLREAFSETFSAGSLGVPATLFHKGSVYLTLGSTKVLHVLPCSILSRVDGYDVFSILRPDTVIYSEHDFKMGSVRRERLGEYLNKSNARHIRFVYNERSERSESLENEAWRKALDR